MRLAEIFALVLIAAVCASSDGQKREKRTLGSIFQFFGFKLVPLNENVNKLPSPEKYEFLAQTSQTERTPKRLNRIQTVMPAVVSEENSSSEDATTQSVATTEAILEASSESPLATESSSMTGDQASDEPAMTLNDGEPLRIVLEDSPSTESSPSKASDSDSPSKMEEASEESTTEMNQSDSSTAATAEDNLNANIQEEASTEATLDTSSESPPETPSEVRFDYPTDVPPFKPLPNYIDQNQLNNFELYRSNDVTNRFFNHQDFPRTFEVHPQQILPRPFTRPEIIQHPFYQQPQFQHPRYLHPNVNYPQYQQQYHPQRTNSRHSTSSTAMNINGKEHFNYLTYHR